MPKNINSASRLVFLLTGIPGHPDNTQTLDVWATLFKINESNPHKKAILVGERLNAMYRETELIREQMQKANFSENLYARALSQVENALSTMLLPGTWNQARQYLTAETFVALSFCGEILPDEESMIAPDELVSIAKQVQELEDSLSTSTLPLRLQALVQHHISSS